MSADEYKPRNPFAKQPKPNNGEDKPKRKIKTFANPFENRNDHGHSETTGFNTSDIVNGKYGDEISNDLSIPYFGHVQEPSDNVHHNQAKKERSIFKKAPKKEPSFDYSRAAMNFKPEILNNPMADMALNTGKK